MCQGSNLGSYSSQYISLAACPATATRRTKIS
jgi:hypothetical protein